jgi:hypothetical protein
MPRCWPGCSAAGREQERHAGDRDENREPLHRGREGDAGREESHGDDRHPDTQVDHDVEAGQDVGVTLDRGRLVDRGEPSEVGEPLSCSGEDYREEQEERRRGEAGRHEHHQARAEDREAGDFEGACRTAVAHELGDGGAGHHERDRRTAQQEVPLPVTVTM